MTTYPSGTHFSGSAVSQFWYRFDEPASASGCSDSRFAHWRWKPSWNASHFAYGP
jgi:hypothetical protein